MNKEKNPFLKNTFILTFGTIIAQIIALAFYPILTRLYSPSDFGFFSIIASITAILSVIASGSYQHVILITETKKIAAKIVWLTIIISFVSLLLFEFFLFISSDFLDELFDIPNLKYWIYICPPTAFMLIIYTSYNEWYVKNKYFKSLSVNKVINTSSTTFSKTIFGLSKIFNAGLIIGEFLGRTITALACVVFAYKYDKEFFSFPDVNELKLIAKKYFKAPKFILPSQTLNSFGGHLPPLMLATAYSAEDLGYFAMALSVIALPSSLISLAVRDTFRKDAFEIFTQTGNCFSLYKNTLSVMALISLMGFSVFYLLAPQLFAFVLGNEWIISGEYARILVPIVALSFVSETGSSMFIIANKMNILLIWQIIYFSLTLITLLIGIFIFNNFTDALLCFMIGRTIAHLTSVLMTSRIANGK